MFLLPLVLLLLLVVAVAMAWLVTALFNDNACDFS